MGEASVSSSRLPYTYMEYSLKLIREVYGDIFWKSAGEAFQRSVGKPLKEAHREALCKTPENKIRKPLMYFWENLGEAQ